MYTHHHQQEQHLEEANYFLTLVKMERKKTSINLQKRHAHHVIFKIEVASLTLDG